MNANEIDWKSGHVKFWDLGFLDVNIPLTKQLSELKEDLAQANFPRGLIIDIGWYPEFSEDGTFCVKVVHGKQWDQPAMQERSPTVQGLLLAINRAIAFAEACDNMDFDSIGQNDKRCPREKI